MLNIGHAENLIYPGCGSECTFTDDRDSHVYKCVQIGDQTWMAENLNIGTSIDVCLEQTDNQIIEKYCYGNLESNCDIKGGLYNWDELMKIYKDRDFPLILGGYPVGLNR